MKSYWVMLSNLQIKHVHQPRDIEIYLTFGILKQLTFIDFEHDEEYHFKKIKTLRKNNFGVLKSDKEKYLPPNGLFLTDRRFEFIRSLKGNWVPHSKVIVFSRSKRALVKIKKGIIKGEIERCNKRWQ